MTKRRRRILGVLPRLGYALFRGTRWCLFHPQPLVALSITLTFTFALWAVVTRSQAFRITDVQVPVNSTLKVPRSLIGKNLWAIDLKALAEDLKAQQPHLKRVRVIRRLPNMLQIEVLERTPVSQVRLGQWHGVDAEGFILPDARTTPRNNLVILKGVESMSAPLRMGRENTNERLRIALRLVEHLRRSSVLVGHRLTMVDVSDPRQVNFVIDDELEIRCGGEDELTIQLERLRTVLRMVARNPLDIRYIDVRFKDPVVGPRT